MRIDVYRGQQERIAKEMIHESKKQDTEQKERKEKGKRKGEKKRCRMFEIKHPQ